MLQKSLILKSLYFSRVLVGMLVLLNISFSHAEECQVIVEEIAQAVIQAPEIKTDLKSLSQQQQDALIDTISSEIYSSKASNSPDSSCNNIAEQIADALEDNLGSQLSSDKIADVASKTCNTVAAVKPKCRSLRNSPIKCPSPTTTCNPGYPNSPYCCPQGTACGILWGCSDGAAPLPVEPECSPGYTQCPMVSGEKSGVCCSNTEGICGLDVVIYPGGIWTVPVCKKSVPPTPREICENLKDANGNQDGQWCGTDDSTGTCCSGVDVNGAKNVCASTRPVQCSAELVKAPVKRPRKSSPFF